MWQKCWLLASGEFGHGLLSGSAGGVPKSRTTFTFQPAGGGGKYAGCRKNRSTSIWSSMLV